MENEIRKTPKSFHILMAFLAILNTVSCFCIEFVKGFKSNISPTLLYVYLSVMLLFIILAVVVNFLEKSKKFWYINIISAVTLVSGIVFLILFLR